MSRSLDLVGATPRPAARPKSKARLLAQRGMATAEYAVGILAAVTLALVLLKVFKDAQFFKALLDFVLHCISIVSGMVK
ncbi:DUF4244 domain-containing protein [Acidipropionibacterium timonense]|uniref:DUF4244 domain-containing protein n=1 Tax=Acidipropionibacterium timonense TaxID=2161818 RepID=UPI00102FE4EB|nr:DUF4244 domain-containing protein [Acidipropionibacterium timonense]